MAILFTKTVTFYSEADEFSFFDFIKHIKGISKFEGNVKGMFLYVPKPVSDANLRNILALFYRYKIDMKQLAQFCNNKNEKWFKNTEKYWFKKIWGN